MKMTASKQIKAAGLHSVEQVSFVTGKHVNVIRNWHKQYPELFEVVLLGVKEKIKQDADNVLV